ncbi:hypothetical protein [Coprothermobacter platensis]|uniref:hypothetical protein n=1 Tax=Coprothermobacter platensis TaxID=108819 RepID=UPI00035D901C|nr:hypothetical protein [Coprothermobacter platensis]
MTGTVSGKARGQQKTHKVEGSPIIFTARWLHVVTEDRFDAYIPNFFSGRTWLVSKVDDEATLGIFVMSDKPMYWLKNVVYVESIYLPQGPTKNVPLPLLEHQTFTKGNLSFEGIPLSALAPLVGKTLWWIESKDHVERVITQHQLQNWLLTTQHQAVNLNTRPGTWINNVTRFCGEEGYITL